MKYLRFLLPLLLSFSLAGQHTTKITVADTGCPSMNLYAFNGSAFELVQPFTAGPDGSWETSVATEGPAFRYVGPKPADVLPVMIGDPDLAITGQCGRLRNGTTSASPLNEKYRALKKNFQQNNVRFSTTMRAYNQAVKQRDSSAMKQHVATLAALDADKRELLRSVSNETPILGKIVGLNTYLSFLNENKGRFANEVDYFVNTYFQFVDFEDPAYGDLPWTYEGNRNFATTLAAAIPSERLAAILQSVYDRWPAGSRAQLFAMSGGFAALSQKKHAATLAVAEEIKKRFQDTYPEAVGQIDRQAAGLRTFSVGAAAPDFTGESPEGESISLSSLRGKIVLIDFWASWCGPCRRENPNVVKMYAKYKDQGFEILGVSLDRTKDRWVKAIAADQLTWLHISDLKGWQSAVARQYGVSSIPQTVLLDEQGNILARNLRGKALEQKLAEIFATR